MHLVNYLTITNVCSEERRDFSARMNALGINKNILKETLDSVTFLLAVMEVRRFRF